MTFGKMAKNTYVNNNEKLDFVKISYAFTLKKSSTDRHKQKV